MIVLIGATGTTGKYVVEELVRKGVDFRCIVRDEDRARQALGNDVALATGDIADPATVEAGCAGCDTLFLLSPHNPALGQQQSDAIDAAKRAGVTRVVKLAGMMTDPDMRIPAQHGIAERYVQDSGTAWTIVRPNFFMQNLLNTAGAVKGQGKMMMPFDPDVPIGMIDARDSAAVCATALTEDGYAEKLLEVTGALVTLNDCAAAPSAVLGTDVPFVRAPLEMAQKMAMDNGAPDWAAEHIGNIVKDIEAGTMSRDTGTVAEILGRPARTIAGFFDDHAALFRD